MVRGERIKPMAYLQKISLVSLPANKKCLKKTLKLGVSVGSACFLWVPEWNWKQNLFCFLELVVVKGSGLTKIHCFWLVWTYLHMRHRIHEQTITLCSFVCLRGCCWMGWWNWCTGGSLWVDTWILGCSSKSQFFFGYEMIGYIQVNGTYPVTRWVCRGNGLSSWFLINLYAFETHWSARVNRISSFDMPLSESVLTTPQ
jgi:hypothetical protein